MNFNKLLVLIALFFSNFIIAQDFDMVDGQTVNTDQGNFFDPGGDAASVDQGTYTYTICPESTGFFSTISFSEFLLGPNTLTIHDGDSDAGPILASYTGAIDGDGPVSGQLLSATDATPTGCLTFVLQASVSVPTLTGWLAEIGTQPGCIPDAPELVNTNNIVNVQNDPVYQADNIDYIVYFNEQFSLTAVAEFQDNFAQETATYNWNFGDGTTLQGTTNASFQNEVSHQYGELCDFTVSLDLSDGYNCDRDNLSFTVRVILNPNSSPGSVNLDAGEDVRICEDPGTPVTVNLEASYLDVKESTAYAVQDISSEYPSNLPYIFDPCYGSESNVFTELNADDDWSSVLTLPYEVNFFGNCYDDVIITDNGAVTFDIAGTGQGSERYTPGGYAGWSYNQGIPADGGGDEPPFINAIFGVMQDLFPGASPADYSINFGFLESQDGKSDRFVFNIYNTSQFGCTDQLQTSQIILYQTTNVIEVYVQNKDVCSWNSGSSVIGIQNQDASLSYVAPGRNAGGASWQAQNEAWRFIPDGGNSITTFRWLDENGNVVSVSENFSPQVTQNRVFTAEVTYNDGCNITTLTDEVEVIYESDIELTLDPDTYYPCEGEELLLEAEVIENNSVVVNYEWFRIDENGNMTAIPDSNSRFLNVSESGTYMINAIGGNCDLTASAEVIYLEGFNADDPEDIILCNYNQSTFDLTTIGGFNSISGFDITYYDDYDADTGTLSNPINDPQNYPLNGTTNQYDIYVELANQTNTACTNIASFNIIIYEATVGSTGYTVEDVCISEGETEVIDLTDGGSNTSIALNGQSSSDYSVTYYSANPQSSPESDIADPENYEINTTDNLGPNTIWVSVDNVSSGFCDAEASFTFNVNLAPGITGDDSVFQSCEGTILNLNEDYADLFNNNSTSVPTNILFYYSLNDAEADNPITDPTSVVFTPDNNEQQEFFVKILNTNSSCESDIVRFIIENNPPEVGSTIDLEQCGDFTLTQTFDLTQNEANIIGSQSGSFVIEYFTTQADAEAGTNSISDQGLDNTDYSPINSEQDIFVRIEDSTNELCFSVGSFKLILNEVEVANVQDLESCIDPVTGVAEFDLTQNTELAFGEDQDETTHAVRYLDASNNEISNPEAYEVSNSATITVEVTNQNDQSCTATETFNLNITPQPEVTPASVLEVCIDYEDGGDNTIDLTVKDPEINSLATGDIVEYYVSQTAYENDNAIATPESFNLSENQTEIYAAVLNSVSGCRSEVTSFNIENVIPLVDISGYEGQSVCIDENGDLVNTATSPPIIETGLSATNYDFVWLLDGVEIVGETSPSITATEAGVYTVEVTNALVQQITSCVNTSSAEIIESGQIDFELAILTDSFQNNEHGIGVTITEVGLGDYEFRLDYGEWFDLEEGQTELIFSDVPGGMHVITARDKNGCGEVSKEITLIDYPEFFTPNADGYNDNWQLNNTTMTNLDVSEVNIFDRYGKHLYKLTPNQAGWDGTYQGEVLPSDDYWFTIDYIEPRTGEKTIFKSHFTLKR